MVLLATGSTTALCFFISFCSSSFNTTCSGSTSLLPRRDATSNATSHSESALAEKSKGTERQNGTAPWSPRPSQTRPAQDIHAPKHDRTPGQRASAARTDPTPCRASLGMNAPASPQREVLAFQGLQSPHWQSQTLPERQRNSSRSGASGRGCILLSPEFK